MSTTVSSSHYEYQGQVYSPAFSEPSSPMSISSSTSSSNPPSPRLSDDRLQFRSKVPKYANKYEESLQPLSPVTILKCQDLPRRTAVSPFDSELQSQFEDIRNNEEMERFLARHLDGIDINHLNSEGRTALQQCCLEGNLPLAKVLVKYGADIRLTTRDGFSTLHLAVFSGHSSLMAYILSLR